LKRVRLFASLADDCSNKTKKNNRFEDEKALPDLWLHKFKKFPSRKTLDRETDNFLKQKKKRKAHTTDSLSLFLLFIF